MSQLSFIQNLGLKLLGSEALASIKEDVVKLTRRNVAVENENLPLENVIGTPRLERFIQNTLVNVTRVNQIEAALLVHLVGDHANAFAVTEAARRAEESGVGFMKKKAAVLKVIKDLVPGISKSKAQLAIELAVQLIKD